MRIHIPIWTRSPWKWFFSLGLGIIILGILTIASIIGTLISPLERAQEVVYYTWWFKLLLLALAVIMSCATYKTVVARVLPLRRLRVHSQKAFFEGAQLSASLPIQGSVEEVARSFRRHGFEVHTEGGAGVARTGWLGRFGAPISHVGMVIVLLAGFASSWVAKEGLVQVPEGGSTSTMQFRENMEEAVPLGFTISVDDFSTGFFPKTRIPSHFTSTVTVREGDAVLYSGPVEVNHSPGIKGWRLHQTSYQEIPRLPRYEVEVVGPELATPISAEISPGQTIVLPGADAVELTLGKEMKWILSKKSGMIASGSFSSGSGGGSLVLVANRFEPDFVLDESRKITSRSQELNNPALQVTLKRGGDPVATQWLFGREDMKGFSHAQSGEYEMEFVEVHGDAPNRHFVVEVSERATGTVIARADLELGREKEIAGAETPAADDEVKTESGWTVKPGKRVTAYATVLTLSRNPAIPTIYFGCLLMMAGLVISFFIPRRDVWFLHDPEAGVLRVVAHYRHVTDRFDRATRASLAPFDTGGTLSTQGKEQ